MLLLLLLAWLMRLGQKQNGGWCRERLSGSRNISEIVWVPGIKATSGAMHMAGVLTPYHESTGMSANVQKWSAQGPAELCLEVECAMNLPTAQRIHELVAAFCV